MEQIRNIQFLKQENPNPQAPILVLLHGYGSNEQDLYSFKSDLGKDFHVLALRGIKTMPMGGYCWFDLYPTETGFEPDLTQAQEALDQLHLFLLELKNQYQNNSIWLGGFSQGAILSYSLSLNFPELIHKTICLSGFLNENFVQTKNKDYAKLDFFISHGKNDLVIPIEKARKSKAFLSQHKVPFVFKEYNSGHGLNQQNYQDLLGWIYNRLV